MTDSVKRVTNIGLASLIYDNGQDVATSAYRLKNALKENDIEKAQQEISLISKSIKSLTDGLNLLDLEPQE